MYRLRLFNIKILHSITLTDLGKMPVKHYGSKDYTIGSKIMFYYGYSH